MSIITELRVGRNKNRADRHSFREGAYRFFIIPQQAKKQFPLLIIPNHTVTPA